MVTASHNPPDYNGMKFVREQSQPISADTGLMDMARLIETGTAAAEGGAAGQGHAASTSTPTTIATCWAMWSCRSSSR